MWFKFSELIIKRVPPSHGESPALKISCCRIKQYRKLNFPNMYSIQISEILHWKFLLISNFLPIVLTVRTSAATEMKLEMKLQTVTYVQCTYTIICINCILEILHLRFCSATVQAKIVSVWFYTSRCLSHLPSFPKISYNGFGCGENKSG